MLAFLLFGALACGAEPPADNFFTLSDGTKVVMYKITEVRFAKEDSPPALVLVYGTDLPIADDESLRAEVGHIWHTLRPLAENKGFRAAAIQASEPPDQKDSKAFTYTFSRHDDGSWREHPDTESLRDPVVDAITQGLLSGNHFEVVDSLSYPPEMVGTALEDEKSSLRRSLSIIEGRLGRFTSLKPAAAEMANYSFVSIGTGSTERLLLNPPYPARIYVGTTATHSEVQLHLNFTPHETNPRQIQFGLPINASNLATMTRIGADIMEGWSSDRRSESTPRP